MSRIEIKVKSYRGEKTTHVGAKKKFKNTKDLGRKEKRKFLKCDMNLLKCLFMIWRQQQLEEKTSYLKKITW